MDALTHRWILEVLASPNLEKLPEKAFPGDVCRHKDQVWVYIGQWMTIGDASKLIYNVEK